MEKINLLKKPKTNIQIMQKNVLQKYKIFTQFLKENYLEIYIELCNIYSDIMGRFYFTNFKTYSSEIYKLYIDLYNKYDMLLIENPQFMRSMLNTRGTNFTQNNKSIFTLMTREEVLSNIDADPIIYHVANQANQRFCIENIFKSLNKLLLDSVASEFYFTLDFFNLKNDQNKVVFGGVFKLTINFTMETIKNLINSSFDCVGLLLIILINEKNKKNFNSRGLSLLDFYFEQINMTVWPRFEAIFELHLNSVKQMQAKPFKILEKTLGTKVIASRYVGKPFFITFDIFKTLFFYYLIIYELHFSFIYNNLMFNSIFNLILYNNSMFCYMNNISFLYNNNIQYNFMFIVS